MCLPVAGPARPQAGHFRPTIDGHSYGGAVISEAGTDEKVAALVYVCAFAPDKDESVNTLIAGFPTDGPQPPISPPRDGFLFLDRDKFHASFAADVAADVAAFMADSQVPWGVNALGGLVTDPAWRTRPSWYLVTTEDRMIPPVAQRTMSQRAGSTTVEVSQASHYPFTYHSAGRRGRPHQASCVIRGRLRARPANIAATNLGCLYDAAIDRESGGCGRPWRPSGPLGSITSLSCERQPS